MKSVYCKRPEGTTFRRRLSRQAGWILSFSTFLQLAYRRDKQEVFQKAWT